jgi:hypothetical protein
MADRTNSRPLMLMLSPQDMEELDKVAQKRGRTKTSIVREGLNAWMDLQSRLPEKFDVKFGLQKGVELYMESLQAERNEWTPPDAQGHQVMDNESLPPNMPDWAREHTIRQREEQKMKPVIGKRGKK